MNELIKITETNGKNAVSARELYEKLGYDLSQWPRWYKKNITNNKFAMEDVDYQTLRLNVDKGRPSSDFALSIDFAKKLSMLARTEAGEKIRQYFVDVEKRSLKLSHLIPQNFADALELAAKQHRMIEAKTKELELAEHKIKEDAPRVEYYNNVLVSKSGITTTVIAKELGMSAQSLNNILEKHKIIYKVGGTKNYTWVMFSKYQDRGYQKSYTIHYTDKDGNEQTKIENNWTERGRRAIHEYIKKLRDIGELVRPLNPPKELF